MKEEIYAIEWTMMIKQKPVRYRVEAPTRSDALRMMAMIQDRQDRYTMPSWRHPSPPRTDRSCP